MTKSDFLLELERELVGLTREEINKTINYYSEMISDMIDSGLTQEEAINKLGKPRDIANEIIETAKESGKVKRKVKEETPVQKELKKTKRIKAWPFVVFVIVLVVIITSINIVGGLYFKSLPREENVKVYEIIDIEHIDIDVAVDNLKVLPASDDKITFKYYTNQRYEYSFELYDKKLEIDNEISYEFFFHFNDVKEYISVLYLPLNFDGKLSIDFSVGDVEVKTSNLFESLVIDGSTGSLSIEDVNAYYIEAEVSTGFIKLEDIKTNVLMVKASTGDVVVKNVTSFNKSVEKVNIDTSTGSINISNVNGNEFDIECSTGDIIFSNIEGNIINLECTTGDINGNFNDGIENYKIYSKTSTGSSSLPDEFGSGPKMLSAKTTTGDIKIKFAN